ncbi:hypothetical protein JCM18918_2633 [Cutibacterium acnes JCM 18918]|nr:hypothetical protein JCM18918_2633 [Cutibacterium acnes JCM 18918]
MVFQDVYLYDSTLTENIRIGCPDATDEHVRQAGALAGVDEIADRLPGGWDASVGEGGRRLSGGERQRVSVARALLKRARFCFSTRPPRLWTRRTRPMSRPL